MESFIKKIFSAGGKQINEENIHFQFMKFSRGEFKDKAMLRMKNSAGKYTLDTTAEYAYDLIKMMAEKLGNNKTLVSGAVVSALDLTGFKYEEKKMAMGVRKYMINREMSGQEVLDLMKSAPKAFFGLSFNVGENELKVQPKSPKSAKGASSSKKEDADAKIDFCKLKTSDKTLVEPFLFDDELSAKKIEIKHDFLISEIVISPELKKEKDFAKIREMALRKGKIIRKLDVEDVKSQKSVEFLA